MIKLSGLEPARSVIERCGGIDLLANALGLHRTTVYSWTRAKELRGTGGKIPTGRQQKILDWAREEGIRLPPSMFFLKHADGTRPGQLSP